MMVTVRLLGPKWWVDLAFRLATFTRGESWFGRNEYVQSYVLEQRAAFTIEDYNKIFGAIYDFRIVNLEAICPDAGAQWRVRERFSVPSGEDAGTAYSRYRGIRDIRCQPHVEHGESRRIH